MQNNRTRKIAIEWAQPKPGDAKKDPKFKRGPAPDGLYRSKKQRKFYKTPDTQCPKCKADTKFREIVGKVSMCCQRCGGTGLNLEVGWVNRAAGTIFLTDEDKPQVLTGNKIRVECPMCDKVYGEVLYDGRKVPRTHYPRDCDFCASKRYVYQDGNCIYRADGVVFVEFDAEEQYKRRRLSHNSTIERIVEKCSGRRRLAADILANRRYRDSPVLTRMLEEIVRLNRA